MFPPYLFAYAETLKAEAAVTHLDQLATAQGARLWITGGTLRDVLLTRWPRDLDLAVQGDVEALGRGVARRVRGKYIPLDPATGTARIAIRSSQGIDWLDLVALRAPTIEADLRARDFTVNAIALPLDGALGHGDDAFIDPTGGRDDLHGRTIRMTSEAALRDDPLRILRAYRFAAQLDFAIEPETGAALRHHGARVADPAPERLHQELAALMGAPRPGAVLGRMMEDGVLGNLLPELAATVGVNQNHYHHLPVWEHTLETVRRLEDLLADPGALGEAATEYVRDPGHREALVWAALLHDVGKPACRIEDGGRIRFPGHDAVGATQVGDIARRLRWPGKKARRVERLVRHHLRPLQLVPLLRADELSVKAVDRLCGDLGDDLPGLFILALADGRASLGPAREPDADKMLIELNAHVQACREKRIRPVDQAPPLLRGSDLTRRFGVAPGPEVGALLEALREARLMGHVATREEAEAWLRERLAQDTPPPAEP